MRRIKQPGLSDHPLSTQDFSSDKTQFIVAPVMPVLFKYSSIKLKRLKSKQKYNVCENICIWNVIHVFQIWLLMRLVGKGRLWGIMWGWDKGASAVRRHKPYYWVTPTQPVLSSVRWGATNLRLSVRVIFSYLSHKQIVGVLKMRLELNWKEFRKGKRGAYDTQSDWCSNLQHFLVGLGEKVIKIYLCSISHR